MIKSSDMEDFNQKQTMSHQNCVDSIFDSMELQEVPESEIASIENHFSDSACNNLKNDGILNHNSETKLAQIMSQDCLQDFRAVLFPDDSCPDLKANDGHSKASTATHSRTELLENCAEMESVSSIIEKVCQEVNGTFETKEEVDDEDDQAVSDNPSASSHVCNVCFLPFTTEKRLQYHQSRFNHHADTDASQEEQDTAAKRPKNYQKPKPFKCDVCDKVLASGDYLKHHMRTHTDERPFKCTMCEKTFRQPSNLHAHMRIHTNEKPFKCKICDKAFSQSGNMHIHMGIHMDKKRFQCPTCQKFFSQNGSLRNHMKIHSGERPHVCVECGKDFVRKSHLDAHMRTHTGEKPFICSFCTRAFSQSGDLQSHMRLHTGDLPHVCSECGKGYSAKSHLTKHMRIHSPERPFECSICGKAYNAKSTLVSHMRLHTGDRPYGCSWCEKRFYSSSHLKKHIKVHHSSYIINDEQKPIVPPRLMIRPEHLVDSSPFVPSTATDGSPSQPTESMNGAPNIQS